VDPLAPLRGTARRLCATCLGVEVAIGSSSGRWWGRRCLSRAEPQRRREVWGGASGRGDADVGLGVPLRCRRSGCPRTPALEVNSLRLCGSARPVRVWRRSSLRAGGGGVGVVCLAQSRRGAERFGVGPAAGATQTWGWVSRADANGLEVLNARAYAELLASLRLCATCPGGWAIGSSSGR
jgi:hypothetical protein